MAKFGGALHYSEHWKAAVDLQPRHEEIIDSRLNCSALDSLFPSGIRRGSIAEIFGSRSTGRTSLCLQLLANATRAGEVCAMVDLYNSFHPASAVQAGVSLDRLIWIRCCGNAEHAMRSTDLLLHAGGFGIVCLDLCEASPQLLNKIPLSYWHRFRRVLANTPSVLLTCLDSAQAKSCALNGLRVSSKAVSWSGERPFSILKGLEVFAAPSRVPSIRPQSLFLQVSA